MNILQTFLKSLFFFFEKKKRDFTNFPETSLQTTANFTEISFFFFLKKKKRFYKLPRNLFTKKVLKKFKLALELPWRLFFWKLQKKKRFYKLPVNLFTNYCKLSGNLFFFLTKKKKRFYKLPGNLFTKKVLKKFKLELELPWRLFFWKLRRFIGKLIALFNSNVIFQP